jgi:hypothetical protein
MKGIVMVKTAFNRMILVPGMVLLILLPLLYGCDPEWIQSQPAGKDIRIDGNAAEWSGKLHRSEGMPFSLGVVNDGQHVYLCINAYGQAARQAAIFGVTVRFFSSLLPKEGFTIHYPVGRREFFPSDSAGGDRRHHDHGSQEGPMAIPAVLKFTGPGQGPERECNLAQAESLGICAAATFSESHLVYELRLPLSRDSSLPGPLGTWCRNEFRMRIECQVPEDWGPKPSPPGGTGEGEPGFGNGPGGPQGGVGMHGHGGGGHRFRGEGRPSFETIDVDVNVKLASAK